MRPDDALMELDAMEGYNSMLDVLTERERLIVAYRFGLDRPKETLEKVGKRFKINGERVRGIQLRALRKLCRYFSPKDDDVIMAMGLPGLTQRRMEIANLLREWVALISRDNVQRDQHTESRLLDLEQGKVEALKRTQIKERLYLKEQHTLAAARSSRMRRHERQIIKRETEWQQQRAAQQFSHETVESFRDIERMRLRRMPSVQWAMRATAMFVKEQGFRLALGKTAWLPRLAPRLSASDGGILIHSMLMDWLPIEYRMRHRGTT